jgi:hypothetical protein
MTVPQSELPPNPNTQRVTLQLPPLPAGETVRIGGGIYAPRGHSAFKITLHSGRVRAASRSTTRLAHRPSSKTLSRALNGAGVRA